MSTRLREWFWAAGVPVRWLEVGLIAVYRLTLGGLFGGNCRFHPSCSMYAELAIKHVGAVKGSALAIWRILRCSPLSFGGLDYPPAARAPVRYDAVIPTAEGGVS